MLAARPLPGRFTVTAGVLLVALLAALFFISARKSPAFDETGDISAGLSYIQFGEVRANLQHPPLLKELAGLSLWLGGYRLPDTPELREALTAGREREIGSQFLAANGPDRALFLARLPFLLLTVLLGALIFLWGRQLLGEAAALAALAIYALDPIILGHGHLATMDVGLAAFVVLFFFTLWNYLEQPTPLRMALCGVTLGLMLCAKFSAIFLLPVAMLLMRRAGWLAWAVMAAVASVMVQAAYLSPGGLFLYVSGLQRVNLDHNPDYLVFLGGEFAHNFPAYFPVAYLLKEPLAAIALVGLGCVAVRGTARIILLGAPVLVFAAHIIFADDLGVRYLIPALPFLQLLGGAAFVWLFRSGIPGRVAATTLGVWLAFAAWGVAPDHLSYFNEAAALTKDAACLGRDGGSACGPRWLDDSNVDWGQSLLQVREWAAQNAPGQRLHLAYFGSFPPTAYGLNAEPYEPGTQTPAVGLYLVSAHYVARAPRASWISRAQPSQVIGHAMYVYRVALR